MNAAQCFAPGSPTIALPEHRCRRGAYRLCRGVVFCSSFSVIFLPEFAHTSTQTLSPIYNKVAGSFRLVDLLLLFVTALHVLAIGCLRNRQVCFPRGLAIPGLAFVGCIGVAIGYGAHLGGSNFFFDWRGLVLGAGLYFVWCFWIQNASDVAAAGCIFLAYAGIRIVVIYALYMCGQRDTLLDVSIPIFDGPVLSCVVFTGLLAFAYLESAADWRTRFPLAGLMLAAFLLVLLCLRRTYWGELAIGTLLLLLLRQRNRARSFALAGAAMVIAAGVLGSSFLGRVQSLDVSRADTQFSADNADHVYDLMDAWYQVRQSPVMGIGLGTSYSTWHIRNWKQDSVMVHNAPLHVWLKYGVAGLICYLWFHVALLGWLYRQSRAATRPGRAGGVIRDGVLWPDRRLQAPSPAATFVSTVFAYLAAQFVMTLGFAPWPYSELQLTILMSFLLAAAGAAQRSCTLRDGLVPQL